MNYEGKGHGTRDKGQGSLFTVVSYAATYLCVLHNYNLFDYIYSFVRKH